MIRRGSFEYKISRWSGGMDVYHAREDVPEGVQAVLRNLHTDGESLLLRNGCTGLPQGTHIGALATAGAKGLYVWTPDSGEKHLLAAYPKAASSKVGLYAIHTSGATALGGNLATSGRISFAGFGQRCYVSDGRNRLLWTDAVSTAPVACLDEPLRAGSLTAGAPQVKSVTAQEEFINTSPKYGGPDAHSPAHFPSWYLSVPKIYTAGLVARHLWVASGTGISVSAARHDLGGGYNGNIMGSASCVLGYVRYQGWTGATSAYGTCGSWPVVGGVQFWARSADRVGEFLELRMGPNSAVPLRGKIRFDQTGRWEYKSIDFSNYAVSERTRVASARIVVLSTGEAFDVRIGPLYRDGNLRGAYEYAPAFYRTSDGTESPLAEETSISTDESEPGKHGVLLPARSSKDASADRVRWYRRGGNSAEWRRVADLPVGRAGWDGYADYETGDLSPRVPLPSPRAKFLGKFGESRALLLNGYDVGDYKATLYTASSLLATSAWTAMSRTTVAGLSRGVEVYGYTAGATVATGGFTLKLQKKVGGTWTTQRSASVNPSNLVMRRWNSVLWTDSGAGKDSVVTVGSAAWQLVFSAMAANTWKLGAWETGKPAFYHLLDYPGRVWVSRLGEPTYFDRFSTWDSADIDGFWIDLPGATNEAITGHIAHGSDHLIFTTASTFLLSGHSASDVSVVRASSSIGCASHDTAADCDNWAVWVGGSKGKLAVYAFGPALPMVVSAEEGLETGFTRVSLAIEPLLARIVDPAKMSAAYLRGKYYLFFGETITYRGDTYNAAILDFAQRSWTAHYIAPTNVKAPRFATADPHSGNILLASPASATAGNSTNRLWWFDYGGVYKDGAQSLSYIVEPRHVRREDASQSKLRGYEVRAEQATAGRLTVNGYGNGVTAGTLVHPVTAPGAAPLRLTGRFVSQGENVGVRVSGTAAASLVIRSINLYLDRVR